MKKLAIFAEGQTERVFLEALVRFLAGSQNLQIEVQRALGGRRFGRTFIQLKASEHIGDPATHFVQIIDSGSDGRVVSDIRELWATLEAASFERIIALRDLRPLPVTKLTNVIAGVEQSLADVGLDWLVAVAVTEIESWFLAEYSHLRRVNRRLTLKAILQSLAIDLRSFGSEDHPEASELLDSIWSLAGLTYDKSLSTVERTVEAIDLDRLSSVPFLYNGYEELTSSLRSFFA